MSATTTTVHHGRLLVIEWRGETSEGNGDEVGGWAGRGVVTTTGTGGRRCAGGGVSMFRCFLEALEFTGYQGYGSVHGQLLKPGLLDHGGVFVVSVSCSTHR